jgi:hypothetical protein
VRRSGRVKEKGPGRRNRPGVGEMRLHFWPVFILQINEARLPPPVEAGTTVPGKRLATLVRRSVFPVADRREGWACGGRKHSRVMLDRSMPVSCR